MNAFWEAHDLIIEALTIKEENFAWDGDHFQYRNVNVWPSILQQPHPPIWMTASSGSSAAVHARYDYHCATFLSGAIARSVFDGYRKSYREAHGREAAESKLAYLAVVTVAGTRELAFHRATTMKGYFDTMMRVDSQFRNPVGFASVEDNLRAIRGGPNAVRQRMRDGRPLPANPTIEHYMDAGLMFVGTPDDVFDQLRRFYVEVGGFGNLLMMGQAGSLDRADTADNLTLFAREVMPRLAEMTLDNAGEGITTRFAPMAG